MAIKFGTDGTIYCNTVRYNYKQARNMIADGSYGNISTSSVWVGVSASTNPAGYRSYRSFKIASNTSLQQTLPTLTTGHKYYYSARVYSDGQLNGAIRLRDSSGNVLSAIYLGSTYTSHTLLSNLFTPTYNITSGNIYCVNYSNNAYLSRFIMIDLTDTFGSGNEPTKEWCDNNIREQETICNFGNIATAVKYSNYNTVYTFTGWSWYYTYNYLQLDSNWEPREYMWMLGANSSLPECYINSTTNGSLNNAYKYYGYIEAYLEDKPTSPEFEIYFPIAEPNMGTTPIVTETGFNGGGGMREWKRLSCFADRSSFTTGSYAQRFDYNNNYGAGSLRCTAINISNATTIMNWYNTFNGTTIAIDDINKEWCDRWIDSRSSPIIHIKDPSNKTIKFNTDYDIVCNDIEIRPELNKIILDGTTGTIKCKKLVRAQAY